MRLVLLLLSKASQPTIDEGDQVIQHPVPGLIIE